MSAIDPMHAFAVHEETFAPKHDRQTSIPEASALRRDLFKLFDQRGIVNAADEILRHRAWAAGDATRCALAQTTILERPHRGFSLRGLQEFLRSALSSRRSQATDSQ